MGLNEDQYFQAARGRAPKVTQVRRMRERSYFCKKATTGSFKVDAGRSCAEKQNGSENLPAAESGGQGN